MAQLPNKVQETSTDKLTISNTFAPIEDVMITKYGEHCEGSGHYWVSIGIFLIKIGAVCLVHT